MMKVVSNDGWIDAWVGPCKVAARWSLVMELDGAIQQHL